MVTLESTVNLILDTLRSKGVNEQMCSQCQVTPGEDHIHDDTGEIETPSSLVALIGSHEGSRQARLTKRTELEEIGEVYMRFCANQPLPLFPAEGFVESLFTRADVTLFAIIAISLRYTRKARDGSHFLDSQAFRDAAQSRIMANIGQGKVDITTLQALCIVVIYDFVGKNEYARHIESRNDYLLQPVA